MLTPIRQDIKGLSYIKPSGEAWVKCSSHYHTSHLAGKWKADLCKHKANKPQGEVIH